MPVTKAILENFTVFNKIAIDFCPGINIIIGENGVGKTHLLKAIYAKLLIEKKLITLTDKEIFPYFLDANIQTWDSRVSYVYDIIGGTDSKPVFIPAKEMLSHSRGLLAMADKYSSDMPFDKTLLDIIRTAERWKVNKTPDIALKVIDIIENMIGGKIVYENDNFYIHKKNGFKVAFSMEAEGLRKIGLLWQLLMNESITNTTILFWDEPEANINPKLIPQITEILLELQRSGVQIFITTHDYITAKYFEVRKNNTDQVCFYSLYKSDKGVLCESKSNFRDLQNNPIMSAFNELLDEVYEQKTGD